MIFFLWASTLLYIMMRHWCHGWDAFLAWLCQQSSWNRNLSVVCRPSSVIGRPSVRPSVSQLSLNLIMHAFLSKFGFCFPWSIRSDVFLIFEKKMVFFFYFIQIFIVFVNMGPYGSPDFKTLLLLQIAAESFQTFLNFLPNGPHENTFGIFEILIIEILTIFFRFHGTQWEWKFQNATPPTDHSQKLSNFFAFSSQWSAQN